MELPETTVLRLQRTVGRLYATIDDPRTRNAMTAELVADLGKLVVAVEADRTIRAVVLQGANGAFCAGADLKAVEPSSGESGLKLAWLNNRDGGLLFQRLNALPAVLIAVVDGPAMGGGMGLTCCADVVVCTERARFALSETRLGMTLTQIAPFVVARLGLAATRRLALTGAPLDGPAALALGLVDRLAASEGDIESILEAILADVERCAPGANAATKALLFAAVEGGEAFCMKAADAFIAGMSRDEAREGVAAFNEKRSPSWLPNG